MKNITKIYLVKNCYGDSNKVYIGKTINSRESNHKKTYGSCVNYSYIDEVNSLNRKDWEPLESYWVEQFRQWGFEIINKNKKGGGGPEFLSEDAKKKKSKAMLGKKHSLETCLKISKSNKGKTITQKTKEKISQSNTGKIRSLETKEKISQTWKKNQYISKPILQYTLTGEFIKEWNSTQEASTFYNIQKGHICNALNGRSKSSNGFMWRYK